VLSLELASAGGVSDARSLAIVYGALVGESDLCSTETLARATATAVDGEDLVLFERTAFGMGFMKPATSFFGVSPNAEAFGHPGSGGSVAFADPVAGIGVAYVTNTLHGAMGDERTAAVLDALYRCL
jgi:CubicO group peptidase (beta-lactamase class C family)